VGPLPTKLHQAPELVCLTFCAHDLPSRVLSCRTMCRTKPLRLLLNTSRCNTRRVPRRRQLRTLIAKKLALLLVPLFIAISLTMHTFLQSGNSQE
jgi:hypothetical protein